MQPAVVALCLVANGALNSFAGVIDEANDRCRPIAALGVYCLCIGVPASIRNPGGSCNVLESVVNEVMRSRVGDRAEHVIFVARNALLCVECHP